MAAKHARTGKRRSSGTAGQMYVYGNVVARPSYEPVRREEIPGIRKETSSQVKKNRKQALRMNPGYVMFLTLAAMLALVICVNYVKLQSRITKRSENITALQAELADMREENNTRYNFVMDAVNLDEIRTKAQNELGMVYASEDQIVEYSSPLADYVKQYGDIPENGVLAQSDKHKTKHFQKKIHQTNAEKAGNTLFRDCTGFCCFGRKNYLY